jgi:hypothetical protein
MNLGYRKVFYFAGGTDVSPGDMVRGYLASGCIEQVYNREFDNETHLLNCALSKGIVAGSGCTCKVRIRGTDTSKGKGKRVVLFNADHHIIIGQPKAKKLLAAPTFVKHR